MYAIMLASQLPIGSYYITERFIYALSRRDRIVVGYTTTYAISTYHH
jgi:hypothetical protein